ncbi:MAG: hypothetical protein ABJH08_07295 [Balneola sp.]
MSWFVCPLSKQRLYFADNDELLEVTPESLRVRKKFLDHNERKREEKKKTNI